MNPDKGLIAVARGLAPADLILKNARIVNTFTGEIESGNIAIFGGRIAGIGDYTEAKQIIDMGGSFAAPGFIDGHTHIESSMLDIGQYARAVIPHGTLGVVTDLHEIANVAGVPGIDYILDSARRFPFDLFLMAPSCVPATHLENAGAAIGPDEISKLVKKRECIGLGEVMNFPGVLFGDDALLAKIDYAAGKAVDGHAPGLKGRDLNAYISAGIASDHESVTLAEAREKLAKGMHIMIREGSSEKNLEALLPLVTDKTWPRCMFVVDDRSANDLLRDGDIDAVVRKAVRLGLDPVRAIQLATINPARYFHLEGLGAIAPGYLANIVVFDSLQDIRPLLVFYRGILVAEDGNALFETSSRSKKLRETVKVKPFNLVALKMPFSGGQCAVIQIVPGQIITRKKMEKASVDKGVISSDTSRDILKLAVVERHHATGNIGLGLVNGLGLKKGAIASSVAHDSHNIVAAGVSDADIFAAVQEIIRMGGGIAVAMEGKIIGSLPLPVAGLLSDQPLEHVAAKLEGLEKEAHNLGCTLAAPFATLSFLALPVIPELRLTDKGLVDVLKFKLVSLKGN